MKRLVFALAVLGFLLAVLPAFVKADHIRSGAIDQQLNGLSVEAKLGQLPLATSSARIQLVDHCYRPRVFRHHGYRHHHHYRGGYAPHRSYRPAPYGYGGYGGYGGGYYAPRSSYYGGGYSPAPGFGLYIGF